MKKKWGGNLSECCSRKIDLDQGKNVFASWTLGSTAYHSRYRLCRLGFKSQLCHLLAVQTWASCLIFLCFNFPKWKMEKIIVFTSWDCYEHYMNVKCSIEGLAQNRSSVNVSYIRWGWLDGWENQNRKRNWRQERIKLMEQFLRRYRREWILFHLLAVWPWVSDFSVPQFSCL